MATSVTSAKGPHHINKDRLLVELEMSSGTMLYGWLFSQRGQRLSDSLNDDRNFIPFEQIDGEVVIVAKSSVTRIVEICNVTAVLSDPNPYRVLNVHPRDDFEIIRKQYHAVLARCHPDKYASKDPSEAFLEILRSVTQALIESFNTIRTERESGGEDIPPTVQTDEREPVHH